MLMFQKSCEGRGGGYSMHLHSCGVTLTVNGCQGQYMHNASNREDGLIFWLVINPEVELLLG